MHIVYFFRAEYFWGQNITDEATGKATNTGKDAEAMADKCALCLLMFSTMRLCDYVTWRPGGLLSLLIAKSPRRQVFPCPMLFVLRPELSTQTTSP